MNLQKKMFKCLLLLLAFISSSYLVACGNQAEKEKVVVYSSVDQVYSEPILKAFEKQSGIEVLPVYDVEASKTTGLSNRLIAEKGKPQADVYWSGEFAQTSMLKGANVLSKYDSVGAKDIPADYKDKDNYYTAFGGRARVLLVNTEKLKPEQYPKTLNDLLQDRYRADQIGIAYPLFGTSTTHVAALYAQLGEVKGKEYFSKLKQRGVKVVNGNSVVRDMVASGQLTMGLTDTDDALSAKEKGKPVELVFLDQAQDGMGTLVIPNTIALIANSPNVVNGKKFIDYLLSKQIEEKLYDAGWIDFTVRPIEGKIARIDGSKLKKMKVSFDDIYSQLDLVKKEMEVLFVQ